MPAEEQLSPVSVVALGGDVIIAGWLMWAVFYPAPPWRNEPLKKLLLWMFYLIVVLANLVVSAAIVYWLYGEPIRFREPEGRLQAFIMFVFWIGLGMLEVFVIEKVLDRRKPPGAQGKVRMCPRCGRLIREDPCRYCG